MSVYEALVGPLCIPRSTDCGNHITSKNHTFEYLGYQFSVFENNHLKDTILGIPRRKIEVDICQDKVEKISNQLINSFVSYLSGPGDNASFLMLENRIKALSGNFAISDPITKINIKTGIYYNYNEKNTNKDCPLRKLDALLQGLLFSKSHKLSKRIINKLDLSKRKRLAGYTFTNGFYNRRQHYFTHDNLKKMKEAWKK